jgi:transposase
VAQGELKQKAYVLLFLVACCGHGANLALPRTGDQRRADYVSERVHSGAPHQQPLETIAAVMRGVLCPATTEKTEKVLKQAGIDSGPEKPAVVDPQARGAKRKARGHGRNSAAAYSGAQKIPVPHAWLKAGDPCPDSCGGKIYPQREPGVLVRIKGQAPLAATVYELEKLRCNLCGNVYTAAAPPAAGEKKYDETAVSMMAVLRYGAGVPWNRTEGLEANFGIPLPAATQCEILPAHAVPLQPAWEELKRQAAQSEVVHNDDTSMRVLSLERDTDISPERTGVFTSGLVWILQKLRIALYFTGCKHAGENLAEVLKLRSPELPPIIQMCDALSRNVPKIVETLVANCNAHGRRNFVKVIANFPDQEHSKPVMENLHTWLPTQFQERTVEPNSGLGQAISYLLNHWQKLTLFLEKAGVPLDNNIVERALKKAILHRKNSLFYKTRKGAQMGDLFMSLIHTCELNDVNAFDYLTELLRHGEELKQNPSEWMPWNYRNTLARLATPAAA